jgi:hypothetical protein
MRGASTGTPAKKLASMMASHLVTKALDAATVRGRRGQIRCLSINKKRVQATSKVEVDKAKNRIAKN